jgi:hypothetical protein
LIFGAAAFCTCFATLTAAFFTCLAFTTSS